MLIVPAGVRAWRARKRFEEVSASKAAGFAAQPRVEIRLALTGTGFMNVFNRIHDTTIASPAVASTAAHGWARSGKE